MGLLSHKTRQAPPKSTAVYVRHRPETTLLHQVVHEYWPEFQAEMADVLIHLYMASAMLKRFEDDGRPDDKTVKVVAKLLLDESKCRDRLTNGIFISDQDDATDRVNKAFHLILEAAPAERAYSKYCPTITHY
jgi:hypothetical protein